MEWIKHVIIISLVLFTTIGKGHQFINILDTRNNSITIDKCYYGTVAICVSFELYNGNNSYINIASGWCIASENNISTIITAAHVSRHFPAEQRYAIAYWDGHGGWKYASANIIEVGYTDVEALSCQVYIPPLKIAINKNYNINDEVLICGIQNEAPPAMITIGVIKAIMADKFLIKGWAWFGHSGGPVILKRTGEVIGIISTDNNDHNNASESWCVDFTSINRLLERP